MGYSIMTVMKDEETKEKMFAFLQTNYKSYNRLMGFEGMADYVSDPTDKLSYASNLKKLAIGFNYGAAFLEREYARIICSWMAVMAGEKKQNGEFEGKPYYLYDGNEEYILFIDEEPPKKSIHLQQVDWFGFQRVDKNFPRECFMRYAEEFDKANQLIQEELMRLTDLWDEFIEG